MKTSQYYKDLEGILNASTFTKPSPVTLNICSHLGKLIVELFFHTPMSQIIMISLEQWAGIVLSCGLIMEERILKREWPVELEVATIYVRQC